MPISIRDEITAVEMLLMDVLSLAFEKRLPPVANLAALTARAVVAVHDGQLIYVTAENNLYRWIEYSTAAADGVNVILPSTLAPGVTKGRWHRVSSLLPYGPNENAPLKSKQTGVCDSVLLYRGDESYEDFIEQVYGHEPSLLLNWQGDDPKGISAGFRGSLYRNMHTFTLFIGSQCLRPHPGASWGSPIPAEAAADPGINALIGLVRYVMAGLNTYVPGIEFVEIGPANKVHEDLDERVFIYSQRLTVKTSYSHEDEDLIPLQLEVNINESNSEGQKTFDPQNYVLSGLQLSYGPGGPLAQNVVAGEAVIAGQLVAIDTTPHTFAASKETYRDVDGSGVITFTAVDVGAPAPPLALGSMRLAKTLTDASKVVQDFWIPAFNIYREGPLSVV